MAKLRHSIVPASYLILLRNNQSEVLLLQRANSGYMDGMYSLIAGHIEAGEIPSQAVIREANEETGLILTPQDLTIAHAMYRITPADSRIDIFFVATVWQGEIENKEPHKCSDIKWVSTNQLPQTTIPYIAHAITSYLHDINFSEFKETW